MILNFNDVISLIKKKVYLVSKIKAAQNLICLGTYLIYTQGMHKCDDAGKCIFFNLYHCTSAPTNKKGNINGSKILINRLARNFKNRWANLDICPAPLTLRPFSLICRVVATAFGSRCGRSSSRSARVGAAVRNCEALHLQRFRCLQQRRQILPSDVDFPPVHEVKDGLQFCWCDALDDYNRMGTWGGEKGFPEVLAAGGQHELVHGVETAPASNANVTVRFLKYQGQLMKLKHYWHPYQWKKW